MNKGDLVKALAAKAEVTQAVAEKCVNALCSVIVESLKRGEEVRLIKFGTFKIVNRREKRGKNPRTGETIVIPAKKVVKFIPGKELSV